MQRARPAVTPIRLELGSAPGAPQGVEVGPWFRPSRVGDQAAGSAPARRFTRNSAGLAPTRLRGTTRPPSRLRCLPIGALAPVPGSTDTPSGGSVGSTGTRHYKPIPPPSEVHWGLRPSHSHRSVVSTWKRRTCWLYTAQSCAASLHNGSERPSIPDSRLILLQGAAFTTHFTTQCSGASKKARRKPESIDGRGPGVPARPDRPGPGCSAQRRQRAASDGPLSPKPSSLCAEPPQNPPLPTTASPLMTSDRLTAPGPRPVAASRSPCARPYRSSGRTPSSRRLLPCSPRTPRARRRRSGDTGWFLKRAPAEP